MTEDSTTFNQIIHNCIIHCDWIPRYINLILVSFFHSAFRQARILMLQHTSHLQQWIYCWFWNFSSNFTLCCVRTNVSKSKTFNYFVCTNSPKSSTDADLSVTCGYTRKILHRRNGHLCPHTAPLHQQALQVGALQVKRCGWEVIWVLRALRHAYRFPIEN